MQSYRGSCHCGAISFKFNTPEIADAIRCNCSICARKGSILSSNTIPPEEMKIVVKEGNLKIYQFATMAVKHHFCAICGIHTFVETHLNPGHYRVNLGCVDGLDALGLPEAIFDGKSL